MQKVTAKTRSKTQKLSNKKAAELSEGDDLVDEIQEKRGRPANKSGFGRKATIKEDPKVLNEYKVSNSLDSPDSSIGRSPTIIDKNVSPRGGRFPTSLKPEE